MRIPLSRAARHPLHHSFFRPLALAALLAGCKSAPPTPPPAQPEPPSAAANPIASPGGLVDEAALDRSVDPCDDFYQFACGGWLAKTPIPADRAQWSRSFSEIDEHNLTTLRTILDEYAAGQHAGDPYAQKLGDYYATCMDEAKAETASRAALDEQLRAVAAIRTGADLARAVARLQTQGVRALFDFGEQQDFKDATQVIAYADQGGLGLPDRDYYLKDTPKMRAIREDYLVHVGKMLQLVGATPKQAAAQAAAVLTLETTLAKGAMRLVDRRDPDKIYHRLERAGLERTAPRFAWKDYFAALDLVDVTALNVAVPAFFTGLDGVLRTTPLAQVKTYLRWQVVRAAAPTLGKAFVDENFRFTSKNFSGAPEILPRWKRCVASTDSALGFALGRAFVERTFGKEGKERSSEMLRGIEAAFRKNLDALTWMDASTKAQAVEKLDRIVNKIGYPDRWRSYDALTIDRSSYLANALRANVFEARRELDKIGKPVDRSEWEMTPPTVNAYYDPSMNEMVFPAGILQPPFFDRASGDSTNYGGIGMVIGHELTHGFDDEGRRFDGLGNLRDWWTPEVGKQFDERAECVAKQYSEYVPVDDLHLDGHLTLGENIADLGGMKLAYAALQAAKAQRAPAATVAGFTEDQQFFLGYAQVWCTKRRDEDARRRVTIDPHSPPRFRVNGVLVNLPEFADAFQCKPGAKMAPVDRCQVW